MKSILVIVFLGGVMLPLALAQPNRDQNDQFRDVTAAGPFPLFITIHWSEVVMNEDVNNWTGIQAQLDGFGLDLGVKVKRSIFFEAGYERFTRSRKMLPGSKLIFNTISARAGWRRTLFYPIGGHMQMGFFIRNTEYILQNAGNSLQTLWQFGYQWGLDGRLRFVVLDPAGTGGGPGFFVEGRLQYLLDDQILSFKNPTMDIEIDRFYGVFSFGIMVPLALRMMR